MPNTVAQKRVVFLAVTNHSVNFDERIRKEAESLTKHNYTASIIATELSNRSHCGITAEGVPFQALSLWTRRFFPRGNFLLLKAIELHLRLAVAITFKKYDCLWVVDHTCAGMIIVGWLQKIVRPRSIIVWDQHELGPEKHLGKLWYQWLIGRCTWVIHANAARALTLQSRSKSGYRKKMLVIENFPSLAAVADFAPIGTTAFDTWLGGSNYCLFQGGAYQHRAILECIEAIMSIRDTRLLVLGPMPSEIASLVEQRWPDYRKKLWVTGWVDPSEFNGYIDRALLSLVFYESIDLNHWLCAPNRLYHALLRGVPVVCGPNPPMKDFVDLHRVGISCGSVSANPVQIASAINIISADPVSFRNAIQSIKEIITWESQSELFERIAVSDQI